MAGRAHAEALIRDFGALIALDGLQLDDDGYCCLSFDDDIVVNLEHDADNDRLLFYAHLGTPAGDRLALCERLLDANFFWQGTNGATLALEKERDRVVLLDQVALGDLDNNAFQARLENFVNMTEGWRARLRAWARDDGEPGAHAELPPGIGMWA